jgi:hypothetical protein
LGLKQTKEGVMINPIKFKNGYEKQVNYKNKITISILKANNKTAFWYLQTK